MCPHCLKPTLCACTSCVTRRQDEGRVIDLELEIPINSDGDFRCPYCNREYNYYESDEAAWKVYVTERDREFKAQTVNLTEGY